MWPRASFAIPVIPTALALAVRLYGLSDKPLWLDEIITHGRANRPIWDLIANAFSNKHFPTYFVLVRAFNSPIIDEWMLRLPSAILGAISVFLIVLIATEVRSVRAGLVTGLLMALSPFEVQFSQEARPYTAVSCFVLLALWGLVCIAQGSVISSDRPRRWLGGWAAYTIGTIGALNVHLVSVPWLLASNIAVAIIQRSGPKQSQLIRDWTVTQVIILLTWAPGLIAMFLWAHDDPLLDFHWFPRPTLQHILFLISAVYLYRISDITAFELLPTLVPGFGVAIAGLALLGAWHLKKDRVSASVITLALISLPLCILLISMLHVIFLPRYFIWSTGPFFVLAGIGAAALPRQLFPLIVAALAVGGIVNLAPYYRYETKPRWDLAAAYLASKVQPGDVVITSGAMAHYVLSKYGARYHLDRDILKIASDIGDATQNAQEERLWVVYGRTGQGIIPTEESHLQKWSALGAPILENRFGRQVVVWLFQPPAAVKD
jgi:mannosyltransferase